MLQDNVYVSNADNVIDFIRFLSNCLLKITEFFLITMETDAEHELFVSFYQSKFVNYQKIHFEMMIIIHLFVSIHTSFNL